MITKRLVPQFCFVMSSSCLNGGVTDHAGHALHPAKEQTGQPAEQPCRGTTHTYFYLAALSNLFFYQKYVPENTCFVMPLIDVCTVYSFWKFFWEIFPFKTIFTLIFRFLSPRNHTVSFALEAYIVSRDLPIFCRVNGPQDIFY